MDLCERCGVELPENAAFCRKCGRRATASWAMPKVQIRSAEGPVNIFSTLAVFFGVVAIVNVLVGAVALVLASVSRIRGEPSSRFAIVVAGCGAVLGGIVRTVVLGGS